MRKEPPKRDLICTIFFSGPGKVSGQKDEMEKRLAITTLNRVLQIPKPRVIFAF